MERSALCWVTLSAATVALKPSARGPRDALSVAMIKGWIKILVLVAKVRWRLTKILLRRLVLRRRSRHDTR